MQQFHLKKFTIHGWLRQAGTCNYLQDCVGCIIVMIIRGVKLVKVGLVHGHIGWIHKFAFIISK